MKINLKIFDGQELEMEVEPTAYIDTIKEFVEAKAGIDFLK